MEKIKFKETVYSTKEKLSLKMKSTGLKITDLYKNVYSSQTGDAINTLKRQTRLLKQARYCNTIKTNEKM